MILRIRTDIGSFDWNLTNLKSITFREILDAINELIPDVSTTAFEYDDEDGDRITVRSDSEMGVMFSYQSSLDSNMPVNIYPKYNKSINKNVFDLKIDVNPSGEIPPALPPVDYRKGSDEIIMPSVDLNEIMSCGNIKETDLKEINVLGKGASGTVYRALHTLSNSEMAVKTIALDVTQEEQRRIMAELQILYKCNSPNIIGFYGAYFIDNRISICTEYMNGCSLDRFGKIDEYILGPVTISVVKGIEYLGNLKIMHRDLKPSNILVNTAGQIKICDFGVSTQLVNSIAKTYIGSNGYMAPERIQAKEYTIKSEIWSIGISVFEMALGRFPYNLFFEKKKIEIKLIELLTYIVSQPPPLSLLVNNNSSMELINLIENCLHKLPEMRPFPSQLLQHQFLQKYSNYSVHHVSDWVTSKMLNLQIALNAS